MNILGFNISIRRHSSAPSVMTPGSSAWAQALADTAARSHGAAALPGGALERLISGLTPEIMGAYIDDYYAGNYRNMAMLWEVIERGDPVCAPVAEKRKDKIDAEVAGYRVEPVNETAGAKRQADWLRGFLAGVTARSAVEPQRRGGLGMASRFMLDALGKGWSCLAMEWRPGPILELAALPLWHVTKVNGLLHYMPDLSRSGGLQPMREGQWVLASRPRAIMEAAALQVLFRRLPEQQMVRVLEKFGIPNVYGESRAEPGSKGWNALVDAVWAYMSDMPCVVSEGTKLNILESNFTAEKLHHPHIERCDRITTINWLGGSLGTFSSSGSGNLAGGAQADDLDDIIVSDCAWQAEIWNTQVIPHALARRYGPGTRTLARMVIEKPDTKDDTSDLKVVCDLVDRGAPVPVAYVMQRFGIPMPADGEPVLLAARTQAPAALPPAEPVSGPDRGHSTRSHAKRLPRKSDRRKDLDNLLAASLPGSGKAYADMMRSLIATISKDNLETDDWTPDEDPFDTFAESATRLVFAAAMMGFEPHRDGLRTSRIAARAHARSHAEIDYAPLPFSEAEQFWSRKILVADFADMDQLNMTWNEARVRGFRIAGVTADSALRAAHAEIGKAVAGDISVTELTSRLREKFELNPRHAEIVARTNLQSAYQWGQWQQLEAVAADMGWLAFDVVGDDATSDICAPLEGLAYPHDHPIWSEFYPPNHYLCRTTVNALAESEVAEYGFSTDGGFPPRDPETGREYHAQHGFEGNIGKTPLADQPGMNIQSYQVRDLTDQAVEMASGGGKKYPEWTAAGLSSARRWDNLPAAPPLVNPAAARARLEKGETVTVPGGESVTLDSAVLDHWEKEKTPKRQKDIDGRLGHLDWAVSTLESPLERWAQDARDVYVRAFARANDAYRGCMVAVDRETGKARTYFVRGISGLDKCRHGEAVETFGREGP